MAGLLERALAFVESGHPGDESDLLLECLRARNAEGMVAVQRMFEDMYGGITFNFELKAPAAFLLPAWGSPGLDALIEGATRTATSKNASLVLQILGSLASRTEPWLLTTWIRSKDIRDLVSPVYANGDLADEARHRLNAFILAFPDDNDAASAIGHQLSLWSYGNTAAAKELFAALATRWLTVSYSTIASFDQLIKEHPSDEPRFQAFLVNYPQLLDQMVLRVWERPDFHGAKEPDFILQRTDNSYLIVEIESPAKPLVTRDNHIGAHVSQAVSQVMQYRTFLTERFSEAKDYFPNFEDPDCLVVIGLEASLTAEQRRALLLDNQHRKGVRIVGFDWLARRAEAVTTNIIHSRVEVASVRMI